MLNPKPRYGYLQRNRKINKRAVNHVKSELELSVRLGRMTLKDFTSQAMLTTNWLVDFD